MEKSEFQEFVMSIHYDPVAIQPYNNDLLNVKKVKFSQLCQSEFERIFFGANRVGCCFNFSLALAKKLNGWLLSCKDNNGTHFAVVYKNGCEFCVCDPAAAKMHENDFDYSLENYYNIPLKRYSFPQGDKNERQQYCIWTNFAPENDNKLFIYGISLTSNPAILEKYVNKPEAYEYLKAHICPHVGDSTEELEKELKEDPGVNGKDKGEF